MCIRRHIFALITAIVASFCIPSWAVGDTGWFGFAVSVDAEIFSFNPTLRSVKVQKVIPTSPAAVAGLAPGDVVDEVQGVLVAGAKADTLKAAMKKSVGETLRLKVKHGSAEAYEVTLIAAPKPAEQ